jgi:hypothetical protein
MGKTKRSFLPSAGVSQTVEWLWACEKFQAKYPALYELLAAGLYEGEARKGATLTIFALDGRLKASISDRQTRQCMWLTLEPFEDVLAEIELAVASGKESWRPAGRNGHMPEGTL